MLAMSSGSPMTPKGSVEPRALAASSEFPPFVRLNAICVLAIDGETPQTRIPYLAYSIARHFVAPSAPDLDAL